MVGFPHLCYFTGGYPFADWISISLVPIHEISIPKTKYKTFTNLSQILEVNLEKCWPSKWQNQTVARWKEYALLEFYIFYYEKLRCLNPINHRTIHESCSIAMSKCRIQKVDVVAASIDMPLLVLYTQLGSSYAWRKFETTQRFFSSISINQAFTQDIHVIYVHLVHLVFLHGEQEPCTRCHPSSDRRSS